MELQAGDRLVSFSESENSGQFAAQHRLPRGGGRLAALAVGYGAMIGSGNPFRGERKAGYVGGGLGGPGLQGSTTKPTTWASDCRMPRICRTTPTGLRHSSWAWPLPSEADRSFAGDKRPTTCSVLATWSKLATWVSLRTAREKGSINWAERFSSAARSLRAVRFSKRPWKLRLDIGRKYSGCSPRPASTTQIPSTTRLLAWNDKYLADRVSASHRPLPRAAAAGSYPARAWGEGRMPGDPRRDPGRREEPGRGVGVSERV